MCKLQDIQWSAGGNLFSQTARRFGDVTGWHRTEWLNDAALKSASGCFSSELACKQPGMRDT